MRTQPLLFAPLFPSHLLPPLILPTMSYGMNENQNVFVDGKRTTSRVTNEPGGKSSIQLGWDPQDECKSGKGKKSLSGVKSSVHLGWDPSQDDCKTGKGKKSIPGAKSSVHLGWDPSQDAIKTGKKERARTLLRSLSFGQHLSSHHQLSAKAPKETQQEKERHEQFMKVVGSTAPSKARTNSIDEGVAKLAEQRSASNGRGVSSNAYANGASQNVGNVITDRPTSRITQPPGGRSSITFA